MDDSSQVTRRYDRERYDRELDYRIFLKSLQVLQLYTGRFNKSSRFPAVQAQLAMVLNERRGGNLAVSFSDDIQGSSYIQLTDESIILDFRIPKMGDGLYGIGLPHFIKGQNEEDPIYLYDEILKDANSFLKKVCINDKIVDIEEMKSMSNSIVLCNNASSEFSIKFYYDKLAMSAKLCCAIINSDTYCPAKWVLFDRLPRSAIIKGDLTNYYLHQCPTVRHPYAQLGGYVRQKTFGLDGNGVLYLDTGMFAASDNTAVRVMVTNITVSVESVENGAVVPHVNGILSHMTLQANGVDLTCIDKNTTENGSLSLDKPFPLAPYMNTSVRTGLYQPLLNSQFLKISVRYLLVDHLPSEIAIQLRGGEQYSLLSKRCVYGNGVIALVDPAQGAKYPSLEDLIAPYL